MSNNKSDIVDAILRSDIEAVQRALIEDVESINDMHTPSGFNAPMLAAYGGVRNILREILKEAHALDFSHKNSDGHDLMMVGMLSRSQEIIDMIMSAYEVHAPHIINNSPEPS
ncbi:hypothetical protein [Shimia sp. MMG029]|uniref:hypothetical protein n=1 Tax=Shimia sp. MMG029 TaxID=3021978 RepID=UPI0022FEEAEA|nr:hypothetical protein [Shimia sp. MMG029]MDA5556181.1 hypothetical protein [Shimia sp. MMG029]